MKNKITNAVESRISEIGITKYRLAKMMDIPPPSIYSILTNNKPSYDTLKKISDALGGKLIIKFEHEEYEI